MKPFLGDVLVFAPDLEVACDFYTEVLGLSLVGSSDAHLRLRGEDFSLVVFACDGEDAPDGHSNHPGVTIALAVGDLDEAVAELRSKGVKVLHEKPANGPVGRYSAFVDPFGTVLELIERSLG